MSNFQYSAFPRITPAVANILGANIFLYLLTLYLNSRQISLAYYLGAYYPASPNFHAYQIISYMFMHSIDFTHILFNMYAVYTFGIVLENVWGTERFVYFYFICGIGAYLLQVGVQAFEVHQITGTLRPEYLEGMNLNPLQIEKLDIIKNAPTIGASGAVYGVLAAFAILFPNTELYLFFVPIPIKAKFLVSGFILFELYLGFMNNPGDNVAHFAHLGGAFFGYLVLRFWNSRNYKRFY